MPLSREDLEVAALELPASERGELARRLIASLHDQDDLEADEAWSIEAERRYDEYRSGNIAGRAAEDVFRDARSRLT